SLYRHTEGEMEPLEFAEGCMWEGYPWRIAFNEECSSSGGKPCRHCSPERVKLHSRTDGSCYEERVWTCPRVVIAENEAGHNSTGVCLDCILEAAAAMTA